MLLAVVQYSKRIAFLCLTVVKSVRRLEWESGWRGDSPRPPTTPDVPSGVVAGSDLRRYPFMLTNHIRLLLSTSSCPQSLNLRRATDFITSTDFLRRLLLAIPPFALISCFFGIMSGAGCCKFNHILRCGLFLRITFNASCYRARSGPSSPCYRPCRVHNKITIEKGSADEPQRHVTVFPEHNEPSSPLKQI